MHSYGDEETQAIFEQLEHLEDDYDKWDNFRVNLKDKPDLQKSSNDFFEFLGEKCDPKRMKPSIFRKNFTDAYKTIHEISHSLIELYYANFSGLLTALRALEERPQLSFDEYYQTPKTSELSKTLKRNIPELTNAKTHFVIERAFSVIKATLADKDTSTRLINEIRPQWEQDEKTFVPSKFNDFLPPLESNEDFLNQILTKYLEADSVKHKEDVTNDADLDLDLMLDEALESVVSPQTDIPMEAPKGPATQAVEDVSENAEPWKNAQTEAEKKKTQVMIRPPNEAWFNFIHDIVDASKKQLQTLFVEGLISLGPITDTPEPRVPIAKKGGRLGDKVDMHRSTGERNKERPIWKERASVNVFLEEDAIEYLNAMCDERYLTKKAVGLMIFTLLGRKYGLEVPPKPSRTKKSLSIKN